MLWLRPPLQALAERRVRLAVNVSTGQVEYAAGDSGVFGIDPQQLVGSVLGDFIQNFSVRALAPRSNHSPSLSVQPFQSRRYAGVPSTDC